jgi:hypothetical protein
VEARLTLSARGGRDAPTVWDRYAVPRLWSTWAPQVRGVDYPEPRLRTGTAGVVRGPGGLRVPFTVDAVDETAMTWSWTVRPQVRGRTLVTLTLDHAVRASGSGSRTWLRLHGPRPVVLGYAPFALPAMWRLVRRR